MQEEDFVLDKWQREVLEYKGNITIRAGRQVGKSEIVSRKAAKCALEYEGITILMIAAAQRQSSELFQKTLKHLYKEHEILLEKAGGFKADPSVSNRINEENRRRFESVYGLFVDIPTKTEANLKNGTRVLSLPTGKSGDYIRCFTIDILLGDEAAYIPEPVWVAVKPMLMISKKKRGLGWEILLSTPQGKGGYYYKACHSDDYKHFHISSETCSRISREDLRKAKNDLSRIEYAQEWLGEFVDEFHQLFPTALIKKRMTFMEWDFATEYDANKNYYVGVDVARFGSDENAFVIGELHKNFMKIIKVITTQRKGIDDTIGRIKALDEKWHFRKLLIDDGGVGGAVYDLLAAEFGNRVLGLNNASRRVDNDGKRRGILKQDLYSHAISMMESENPIKIELVNNLKMFRSLKSMTFEYTQDANVKIYGNYSHIAEAFVRCCWATKAKGLKLFVA